MKSKPEPKITVRDHGSYITVTKNVPGAAISWQNIRKDGAPKSSNGKSERK